MRRRIGRRGKKDSGAPKWMVTYSDMVTLILVFFILLFAMSQIDNAKFEAISDSFKNRAIFEFYPSAVPLDNPTMSPEQEEELLKALQERQQELDQKRKDNEADTLDNVLKDVNAYLERNKLKDKIAATRTDRGVELILQENLLFESADAQILDSGKPFLDKIAKMLEKIPNYVRVEGHTDNRPISNFRYPSNWELSGARASGVIRYLLQDQKLSDHRFSAIGYGDTRPLVPNTSEKNWKKNRRVEIVILEKNQSQQKQR